MITKKPLLKIFLFFVFAILVSCGGGGGGSSSSENPVNPPPVSPSSFSLINGFIYVGNDINQYPDGLTTTVELLSLDRNQQEIDRKTISTTNGRFSMNVSLSQNGGRLVITASSDGYTPGTKTIDYSSPEDLNNLKIGIKIDPVKKTVVSIQKINLTSINGKTVKVYFFKDGKKVISTNSSSGQGKLLLSLAIPVKKMSSDTQKLLISYKGYKPSNPEDYQNFPGTETDEGNDLVSVGFFTLDIKDPKTGKSPFNRIETQLARNKGEYYRLLTYVDCEQLKKIREILPSLDEDPDKEGVQLTFYAFDADRGVWVKAGEGTFVDSYNVNYSEFGEDPDTIDTAWDYIIFNGCVKDSSCFLTPNSSACVDVDNDGTDEDVSCIANHVITDEDKICEDIDPVYVVVSVTNPSLEWKNLDYIKPKTKKIRFSIVAKDDEGNPVSIPVFVEDAGNGCVEYAQGYTSSITGKVQIETLKYCNNTSVNISYINPFTNTFQTYSNNPVEVQDNGQIDITIFNTLTCKVKGRVVDANTGKALADIPVSIYNLYYYQGLITDNDGNFETFVPCDEVLNVSVSYNYYNQKQFNVDNVKNFNEVSDSNKTVILEDFPVENYPPYGSGTLSTYATKWGEQITAYINVWDTEGNIPIKYKLKIVNSDNDEKYSKSGEINGNYASFEIPIDTSNLPKTDADYYVYLLLADSKYTGDITTQSQKVRTVYIGKLLVNVQNSPPTIDNFYVLPETVSRPGKTIAFYGSAYDIDGNDIKNPYIEYRCFDMDNNTIESNEVDGETLLTEGTQDFVIPSNQNIRRCIFFWHVSDGEDETVSPEVAVSVQNTPPSVLIWPEEEVVSFEEKETKIYAEVFDIDGDTVSCKWYVNGILDNDQNSCQEYNLDLSNFDANQQINVRIEATDGIDTTSKETTIYYGRKGNIEIIIQ